MPMSATRQLAQRTKALAILRRCGAQLHYYPQTEEGAPPVQRLSATLPPEEEQSYSVSSPSLQNSSAWLRFQFFAVFAKEFNSCLCFQAADMCSMPAAGYDFEPPHLHSVVLPDLVIACSMEVLYVPYVIIC